MADYYVSPTGDDSANGSMASPFLTVVKGLNAVSPGDRLILREGVYREKADWFPPKATEAQPIVIEGYPGENATISALVRITGWQAFDLTGGRAIYRAQMPFTLNDASAVAGADFITCNGVPVNEAQWPVADSSKYPQKSANWASADGGAWLTSPSTVNAPVTVQIQDSDLTVFANGSLVGGRITLLPGARWALVSGTISANVGDKLTFTIKSPGGSSFYSPDSRSLYFLFGKSVFLSTPGSWWRDPDTNYLYLWLPDSSDPNNSIIEAKKNGRFLDFYARSHYRFKNLTFAGGSLSIYSASNMKFESCTFKWYSHKLYSDQMWGYIGPALFVNGDLIEIVDCDFFDSFGNTVAPEAQAGFVVKNCVMANTGGVALAGVNARFLQNTVDSCPGGCFKLNNNVTGAEISYNDFGRAGEMFTDGGIFLIAHYCTGGGARISRNYLHDGYAPSDGSKEFYGSAGFYFEGGISNLIFDHNITCRTTSPGLNLATGAGGTNTNIKFYNNTFDGTIFWLPSWAGNPAYPGIAFYNNYFTQQAPNTGYHPDLQFFKNAFKVLPGFLGSTTNIATPNPNFGIGYFLGLNSPLRSAGQAVSGITTDPFPDIGAREGAGWIPGATVRQSDVPLLEIASYSVVGDRAIFVLGNLPFGRRLGDNFKMKLGSGVEAVGTEVAYSTNAGTVVWARVGTGDWEAIGQIEQPPILGSLSSDSGMPGTTISLLGNNFKADSSVLMNGVLQTKTYINSTRLDVTVSSGAVAGTLLVSVVGADGQTSGTLVFSILSAISLTNLSTNTVSPGQQIQLTGTGFKAGAIARFNATEVSTDFSSSTLLGVQIPVLPAGATSIKVINPDGAESETLQLTVVLIPSIASFSPNPIRPGQELSISGERFGADPYVLIGGTEVIPISYTETSLVAVIPGSTFAGTPQIRVVSEVGQSLPVYLTVIRDPALSTASPASAPVGIRIVLTGADLIAGGQVLFGETPGIAPSFIGTSVSVTVPNLSAGTVAVKVVSAQGAASNSISFEVLPSPTILSVFPALAAVGDAIAVVGENFLSGIEVFLSDLEIATGTAFLSIAQLSVIIPDRPPGAYKIWVRNPDGGISEEVDFLIPGRPAVVTVFPIKALPGAIVTVTGSYFEFGISVRLGTVEAVAVLASANSLSFVVPEIQPGTVDLALRNLTELESIPVAFEVLARPVITSAVPESAVAQTEILISGSNFKSDVKLYLDDRETICVRESATSLKMTVPSQLFGTFALKAANVADGLLSPTSINFTILRKPVIGGIVPTAAQPGSTVKISGIDFEDPAILLDGSAIASTSAGGILSFVLPQFPPSVLPVRVRNSTNVLSEPIAVTVLPAIDLQSSVPATSAPKTAIELQGNFFPADALVYFGNVQAQVIDVAGDRILVEVPNLPAIPTAIAIRTPAGAISTNTVPFDVLPALAIYEVTPNPAPPGTEVEIRGSGFEEGVLLFVRNAQAIELVRVSDRLLKFVVPQLVSGSAQIRVVLPDAREAAFAFTVPSVWISGISHATVQVGEWLEITGTGFVHPLTVTVGGVAATEIIAISSTLIKVRVPPFLADAI